ncbi:MAG: WHG domain-containing protein [Nocardioides sp.]
MTAQTVADGGPDSLSLRALARAADTSTTAIYTIFGSKDELVAAVLDAAAASLTRAQDAVPTTDDALGDFAQLGRAYRRWALNHPDLYNVMFGRLGMRERTSPDQLDGSMRPLLDAVHRCIDEGVLRQVDARQAAISIWAAVHGLVSLEIAGYLDDESDVIEEHLVASAVYWLPRTG